MADQLFWAWYSPQADAERGHDIYLIDGEEKKVTALLTEEKTEGNYAHRKDAVYQGRAAICQKVRSNRPEKPPAKRFWKK